LIPVGAADDFANEPGEVVDGHVSGVSVIVDPVLACFGMLADLQIF